MEDLRERVEAVERALTDGNGELRALAEGAASADRVEELSNEVASLQDEVAELSAATQALRGYVGNVRSVNESVEERADAAVAAVDALEERVAELEATPSTHTQGHEHTGTESAPAPQDPPGSERDPSGRAGAASTCSACGRPSDAAAAPDGGRSHRGQPRSMPAGDESGGAGQATATRDPLPGFDPNDGGGQVTVREESTDPVRTDGQQDRNARSGADQTLVDRMREML